MGWQRHTFEFTGAPTDHLTFTSLDPAGDAWGPALDNITVEKLVPTTGTGVRHLFTGKERDTETNLDYFGARYLSAAQGRFTSVDPTLESAKPGHPQTWNRYTYALNNPLRYIDPDGQIPVDTILDVASLGMSLRDLVRNPSWAAAGYAAWDLGAAALPYVPGSWVGRVAKYGHQGLEAAGVLKRLDDFEGAVNNRYIKEGVALLGQGDDSVRKVLGLSSADKAADFLGVTHSGKYIIGEAKGSDLASAVAQLSNTAKALMGKLGDVKFSAEVVLRKGQKLDPNFRVSGTQLERFNAKTQKWELQKALDQAINVRYVN
jgi:RHS repeat-associated protein